MREQIESDETYEHIAAARARTDQMADRIARLAGFKGQLRSGEIVRLKSGSPPMVIAMFDVVSGLVHCQWNLHGRPFQGLYAVDVLEPAEPVHPEFFTPPRKPGKAFEASAPDWNSPAAAENAEAEPETSRADSRGEIENAESPSESVEEDSSGEGEDEGDLAFAERSMLAKELAAFGETIKYVEERAKRDPDYQLPERAQKAILGALKDVEWLERYLEREQRKTPKRE